MNIKVNYFGLISEITGKQKEILEINDGASVAELHTVLEEKYQKLRNVTFKTAVDKKISTDITTISDNTEVAILPPFAGG